LGGCWPARGAGGIAGSPRILIVDMPAMIRSRNLGL
jgi:hypothetical protein